MAKSTGSSSLTTSSRLSFVRAATPAKRARPKRRRRARPNKQTRKVKRRGVLLLVASALIAVCVGAFGFLQHLAAIAALLVVMAAGAAVTNIHLASWIQGRVDATVRGRVVSVLMLSVVGLQPISLAGASLLAAWNLTGMFLLAAAALLTVTIAGAMRSTVRAIV
jgi:hypothetical protein